MKTKYRVEVEVLYTQHIDVEADSMEEAEATALDQFDVNQASETDSRIHWTTNLDNPSWLDQPIPFTPTQGETK
jgi:hypothetical protein